MRTPSLVTPRPNRESHHGSSPQPVDDRWVDQARCLEADPDVFFPAKGEPVDAAKRICDTCPVVDDCLAFALHTFDVYEDFGVWGGTSENERRRLRRDLGIEHTVEEGCGDARGTEAGYKRHRRKGEQACRACLDGNRLAAAKKRVS